jgi:hypothetical protein
MSGGGKGAKSAKAPDYTALAEQQGAINQKAAQELTAANRPNQYDPFGNSITWSQANSPEYDKANTTLQQYKESMAANPNWDQGQAQKQLSEYQRAADAAKSSGQWSQQQTLNPETKAIWEKYQADAGQAGSQYGDILNQYLSSYKPADLAQYDPNSTDKAYSDALYGSVMDRGRKEQTRETDQMNTQLRNSGLVPGSEAYNRAMQNLMTSQNDANLLAAQNATLAGGQEARSQYATQLQGQLAGRNQPLQELAGMAGIAGGQPYTPTYQGFSGATGYNPTDLVGAAQAQYGAKQAGANASNSKKGGLMGAGASLGGSYLGSK